MARDYDEYSYNAGFKAGMKHAKLHQLILRGKSYWGKINKKINK